MAELTTCEQCGATDDHPMVHFGGGGRSVHHDCMSKAERDMVSPAVLTIADQAAAGVHGDELREFIISTEGGTL